MRRLAIALLLATSLAGSAWAQAVVTPRGSAFGLAPPPGFATSTGFSGFADPARPGASIAFSEMPPVAYAEMVTGMDAAALGARGIDVTRREDFATKAGTGVLITGSQRAGEQSFAKWMLLVPPQGDKGATGLVVVTLPGEPDAATTEAVRASLASLTFAPVTLADKVAALPFGFSEGAKLKVATTLGGNSVILTPGGQPATQGGPMLVIGFAPSGAVDPANRVAAAMTLARQLGGRASVQLEEPATGGDTVRLMGDSTEADGTMMRFVQWVTFLPQGYLRIVGMALEATYAQLAPEFGTIAQSVTMK